MMLFAVTLSVIGGLQLFDEPYVLTGGSDRPAGGPDQAGMTSALYLYRMAFDFSDFGGASAMSWLLFVLAAALTWATNRLWRERA
jgi:multiple sugar transport system permease protein